MMLKGDVFVDPGPLPEVSARYINDPLDEDSINCKFVERDFCADVVSIRAILAGEELFMSYGEAYWSQYGSTARVLKQKK